MHRSLCLAVTVACGFTAVCGLAHSAAAETAEETAQQKCIVSIERIWDRATHSAFTDLIQFQGRLYCTFREGDGHIPGLNGLIRVLRSDDGANWQSVALLDERGIDLRDPKLCVTPDGRLMINCGASTYHGSQRQAIDSRVAFSDSSGEKFGPVQEVVLPTEITKHWDWLWRVTWHDGWAWGCVQQVAPGDKRRLQLVRSRDGITYERVTEIDTPSPSETTLRFKSDGEMVAMIRHGKPGGRFGVSKPPYTDWKLVESNQSFGGPNLMQLPNGAWLAGSREYLEKGARTVLWSVDLDTGKCRDLLTFPSGGDNSYPGFVIDEPANRLWMSYYSTHETKTSIFLVQMRLDAVMAAAK